MAHENKKKCIRRSREMNHCTTTGNKAEAKSKSCRVKHAGDDTNLSKYVCRIKCSCFRNTRLVPYACDLCEQSAEYSPSIGFQLNRNPLADSTMMTPHEAHLVATNNALRDAHEQTAKLKRRLRQYANTLDAVSARAREEVASAVEARNDARAQATKAECRADDYAEETSRLRAALAESRARHETLARELEQANTNATKARAQADSLRVETSRLRVRAKESDRRRAERDAVAAQKDAELYRVKAAFNTIKEERDSFADEARTNGAELLATRRELAIVRHQLETRAPPEITPAVRADIGEVAARAVERRAMRLFRAIAEHYAEFSTRVNDETTPAVRHDKECTVSRDNIELPVETVPVPAVERLINLSVSPDDDLQDIRNAEDVLREHLDVIKRMVSITTDDETDPADILANGDTQSVGDSDWSPACENQAPEGETTVGEIHKHESTRTVRFQDVRRDQLSLSRNG